MNLPPILDGFVSVRVHKSIAVIEMVHAAASIGCVLQASNDGLTIVRREVKKRKRRDEENVDD